MEFFAIFWIIWLVMFGLMIVGIVFWIRAIVEIVKFPDAVWAYARTDKTTWLLIVILLGWIGALVYWFSQRQKLLAVQADLGARGMLYAPPPSPQPYGYQQPQQTYGYAPQPQYPPAPPPAAPPEPPASS